MIPKALVFLLGAALVGLGASACSQASEGADERDAEVWLEIEPQGCDRPFKFTVLSASVLLELCKPGYQVASGQPWLHLHDLASGDVAVVEGARSINNPRGATAFTLNDRPVFGVVAQSGAPANRDPSSAQRLYIFSTFGELIGRVRFLFHDDIEVLGFDVNPYAQCAVVQHRPESPAGMPRRLTVLDLRVLQADLVGDDPVLDLRDVSALTVYESEAWIPGGARSSWLAASGYQCIRNSSQQVVAIGGASRVTGIASTEALPSLSYIDLNFQGHAVVRQIPLPPDTRLRPNGAFSTADQAIFLYRQAGVGSRPGKNTGMVMFGRSGLIAVPPLEEPYEWRSFDPRTGIGMAECFPIDPSEQAFIPPPEVGPVSLFACRPDCTLISQGPTIRGPLSVASDGFNQAQQVLRACSQAEQPDPICARPIYFLIPHHPLELPLSHD